MHFNDKVDVLFMRSQLWFYIYYILILKKNILELTVTLMLSKCDIWNMDHHHLRQKDLSTIINYISKTFNNFENWGQESPQTSLPGIHALL